MRSFFALFAVYSLLASGGMPALAADNSEVVNPFDDQAPSGRSISASVSDEPEPLAEPRTGFSLPKLALPKLPKPTMPKFKLPKLKMPKLAMPQWTKREPAPNTGPSTWTKLNNGTKSVLAKTRNTLMPWTVEDARPPARSVTGGLGSTGISRTRVASNRGNRDSTDEKESLFSSFRLSPEPKAKRIETTNDFLSQERPRLD